MQLQASSLAMDTGGEAPSTYAVISEAQYCGLKSGGYPARCYDPDWLPSQCEALCDASPWCLAYSGVSHCALMTSTGNCPIGNLNAGGTATSASDLVPSSASGYSCMAKNPNAAPTTAAPTTAYPTSSPTDYPTSSPTDSPTAPPTHPKTCSSWCKADTRTWLSKCMFQACDCEECQPSGIVGAGCEGWCKYSTLTWETKCAMKNACGDCYGCRYLSNAP